MLAQLQRAGRRDLDDFMTFEVGPDVDHPDIRNDGMQYEGKRFRAECKLAGKLYGYGILIETKSGASEYGATVEQLSVYRAVMERPDKGARLLAWGVTERGAAITPAQLAWLQNELEHGRDDIWAFSLAADIHNVLHTLFGSRAA